MFFKPRTYTELKSGELELGPKLIKWTGRVFSVPDSQGHYVPENISVDIDETYHCYDFKTWEEYWERDELVLAFYRNEVQKQIWKDIYEI